MGECNLEQASNTSTAYMGEEARVEVADEAVFLTLVLQEGYHPGGPRELLYHDIADCHWDYEEHDGLCYPLINLILRQFVPLDDGRSDGSYFRM